jgi:basic amino acid/polyamine antiporter, APA family
MEAGTERIQTGTKVEAPTLFVRKASGLLKSWSGLDAFVYATLSVNVVALGLYYGLPSAAFIKKAEILPAVIAAGVFVSFLIVCYSALITTMPRAGGDYVWQSRVLGGGLAFVLAVTGWWFILWHWAPIYGDILNVELIQPLFATLDLPEVAKWFGKDTGEFVTSLGVIVAVGTLVALGMEGYARFQRRAFWLAGIGLLIMLGLMLFSSQADFQSAFNRETADLLGAKGNSYKEVTDVAAKRDFAESPGISPIGTSMLLLPFVLFFLLYPNWGATLYGEIRGAGNFRRVFLPIFAGLWVTVLAAVAFIFLADKTFGWDFYLAANFLGALPGEGAVWPYPGLMVGWLVDNTAFQVGLLILLSLWFFAWMGTLFLSSTRVIFAVAFDRILPEWAASVTEKRRVPVGALALMLIPSVAVSALYAYSKDFQGYTLAATLVIAVTFLGSIVTATVLPWRRPDMWRNSPASKLKIGPVPLVPIAGLITLGFLGWTIVKWLTDDQYGLSSTDSFIYMGSLYGLALAVYGVARLIRWRQGIDLRRVYREIPAE